METLSIAKRFDRDPRKLAYLCPRLPLWRYKEIVEDWHRAAAIRAAEEVARMFGAYLLPASCVHHKRRRSDRRLMIYGRNYYVMQELTALERQKLQDYIDAERKK